MASELLIRPGLNDLRVLEDLIAPGGASVLLPTDRPLISRLVVEAHVAKHRPGLAAAAGAAGIPVLIDPLTFLWQSEQKPADRWASLTFGCARRLRPEEFADLRLLDSLVAAVVDFELDHGASAIVPPYTYAASPSDPWFAIGLRLLQATARYMRHNGVNLPLVPVFCGQLHSFADPRAARLGVGRFADAALDVGPQALGLCMSPSGASGDTYSKILRLFNVADALKDTGASVLVFRQGALGPALVAGGVHGYETGVATGETTDIAGNAARRRPPKPGSKRSKGGPVQGIYIGPLGRTVPPRVGLALLGDRELRPKVMCDDERCCPNGAADTIDRRREHAIRTRAKQLAEIDGQPHRSWRLHSIAKEAASAADLAVQANAVLAREGLRERINPRLPEALARVAEFVRERDSRAQAA